jgi:predicted RNase H-like HicB family nuclease
MAYKVLVTKQHDSGYTARALVLPDVVASGTTEAQAIDHLRDALADLQTRSRVVDVDLPLPDFAQGNPRLRFGGMWADDPDWEVFQDAIVAARREIDAQAQPT